MLCRQKLREFKQGHDVQGGSSDDKQGGASSDDDDEGGEPAEPRFVIDDEGQITFQDIIKDSLEEEVHAFIAEIEHNNIRKMHGAYCCPYCPFRAFGRLCQLSDHLRRHHVAAKQFVCSGKKQLKVILALHDSDSVRKENGADYLFRSAMLLRTQVVPPLDRNKSFIDKNLRLLLEKDGPRYVNQKALGEQIVARRVLNIYYDKSFAEMVYREIVLHHSSVPWQQQNMHVKSIWPRVHLRALEAGNMLGNLYPSHTRHWWPLVEDIYMSYQVQSLKSSIFKTLEHSQEFLCLSIDATLKVCMTVQGQANYRASAQTRNAACFDDEHSLRRVLTIRGRTGAVLGMVPLKEICPNLSCLSLDPVHLAIVYEYAQWGKKTAGSKVLRCLLHKMNQVAPNMRSSSWGPLFTGTAPPSLTRNEERARHLITDGSMGATRAKHILDNLHPDLPLFCRITFIEALAALCATYPHEVSRKVTGSNKEIRKVLWAATAPDRLEWLMNNLRVRHDLTPLERGLLPSGTSSNESLHAEINSWTKSIRSLHQSTLRLKLEIMQFGKVLAHHVASCFPTVQQTSEAVLLARAVATDVWTDATWQNCCSSAKAPVPLHRARQAEARKVQKWKQTIPIKRRGKRTVHSVKRVHSIRSSGVKPKRLRR
ncbi:unnamed protein product [Cladocopium goreaui]|uniref:C2H2-type domain-containing protein n=1 Tax=Cladocopium goreaui TaxID=2562237 RepID=A0A9P1GA27_9DINO|nr:unnamed protein product [Cladocopium goreaui]